MDTLSLPCSNVFVWNIWRIRCLPFSSELLINRMVSIPSLSYLPFPLSLHNSVHTVTRALSHIPWEIITTLTRYFYGGQGSTSITLAFTVHTITQGLRCLCMVIVDGMKWLQVASKQLRGCVLSHTNKVSSINDDYWQGLCNLRHTYHTLACKHGWGKCAAHTHTISKATMTLGTKATSQTHKAFSWIPDLRN